MKIYKVGPKNKHVSIPEGWEVVTSGDMLPNYKWCNIYTGKFECITSDDDGMKVEDYDLVIKEV